MDTANLRLPQRRGGRGGNMKSYTARLSTDQDEITVKIKQSEFILSFEEAASLHKSLAIALEPVSVKQDEAIRDAANALDKIAYQLQSLSTRAGLAHVNTYSEIVFRVGLALHHLLIPGMRSGVEAGIAQPDAK
jgi:hypothetical protein